jgi:hypothetical protein
MRKYIIWAGLSILCTNCFFVLELFKLSNENEQLKARIEEMKLDMGSLVADNLELYNFKDYVKSAQFSWELGGVCEKLTYAPENASVEIRDWPDCFW